MQLDEDQGKKVFSMLGIPVPSGDMVTSPVQARDLSQRLGYPVMVKALVRAGRRRLAGGIRQAGSPTEVERTATQLLGSRLYGQAVLAVRVEECIAFERELYLSVTLDRAHGRLVALVGGSGGVLVEKSRHSEFATAFIPTLRPFHRYEARDVVRRVGLSGQALLSAAEVLYALAEGAKQHDLLLAEINPLLLLGSGEVVAADAKVVLDDDAEFRQQAWRASFARDRAKCENSDRLVGASGLHLVRLPGNIGVVGGGAGLCMATMDAIGRAGGEAANFLDVGGGVSQSRIVEALELVVGLDVEGILVNVYGGINNCATIASGVVEAVHSVHISKPLVVRMQGHFEKEGWALLEEAGVEVVKRGTTRAAAERLIVLVNSRRQRSGCPS